MLNSDISTIQPRTDCNAKEYKQADDYTKFLDSDKTKCMR